MSNPATDPMALLRDIVVAANCAESPIPEPLCEPINSAELYLSELSRPEFRSSNLVISKWCKDGSHEWCMNRDHSESRCQCPCHAEKTERRERDELARLKAKYEPAGETPTHVTTLQAGADLDQALDTIKFQQEEIERLRAENARLSQSIEQCSTEEGLCYEKDRAALQAEINRLRSSQSETPKLLQIAREVSTLDCDHGDDPAKCGACAPKTGVDCLGA